jgi:antirestriction protein
MEMKIYVANLAAYVSGHHVGGWIDLPMDEVELKKKIGAILNAWNDGYTPSEECAIHDYELPFSISEYTSPYKVNEWAEIIANSHVEPEVLKAILGIFPSSVEEGLSKIENGEYTVFDDCDTMSDVAYMVMEESGQLEAEGLSDVFINHFDYESYGNELDTCGTYVYCGNDKYVEIHQ